jgi:hypothetical protein
MEASPGCLDLSGIELPVRHLLRAELRERGHHGSLVFVSQFEGIGAAVDVPIGTLLVDLHC